MALCLAHSAAPPDPREAREAEILQSIRTTFAEKGFDGASMQELARAAGMSVGNFYRYFPSKAAMVEAMIRRDIADVEVKFAEVLGAPDPLAALRHALHSGWPRNARAAWTVRFGPRSTPSLPANPRLPRWCA